MATDDLSGPGAGGATALRHVVAVRGEDDVLHARVAAREIARSLGAADAAVTRLVACVGSLAHDLDIAGGGEVDLEADPGQALHVRFTPTALPPLDGRSAEPVGWAASAPAVALVVDRTTLGEGGPVAQGGGDASISLTFDDVVHHLPAGEVADLRARLRPVRARSGAARRTTARATRATWNEQLREQSRDLLMVLAQLQSRDESPRRRMEAEEAADADGIIGLYHELSEELERTNQGVVALYAELDDKSRQLREASEAKTRFMRNISHELRSPSNSIIGLARLLLDAEAETQLAPEQHEQVTFIETSARDLLGLVDELLDLAAAESGRMDATPEPVDLADLFDELSGVTRPLVRDGVALHVHAPEPGTVLHTDRTLLRHILRNLLSNAAKFTAAGRIDLSATTDAAEPDQVAIVVADTGIGISEEDRGRVFEEFYQARSPLHAGVKGTGLGLAFAQRIAVTLGGSLELASTPGAGSRFSVHLPWQPSAAPAGGGGPA